MLSLSRPLSRRSLQRLLAGALVVPVSGCDLNPDSTPVTPPPPSADETLVEAVTARIREVRDLARAVPGTDRVAEVHDAHLAALGSPAPSVPPSSSASSSVSPTAPTSDASPTSGERTFAALAAAERSLELTLTDAAMRAEDGRLARLLASMGAAVAQQIVALHARRTAR